MTPEQLAARIRDTAGSLGHAVSMGASPVDVERDFINAVEDLIYSLRWVDRSQFAAIREALCTTAVDVVRNSGTALAAPYMNASGCLNCDRDSGKPRPGDTSQSTTSGSN